MRRLLLALLVIVIIALALPPALADDLIVVNGKAITREALVDRLLNLSVAGQSAVEEMVNETLLAQAAQKKGITVSDADVDARLASIRESLKTDQAFKDYLTDQEVTMAGLRQKLGVKLTAEKLLANEAKVTDKQVEDFYNSNKSSFESPETVTLSVILTKTKDQADQAVKRLAKGESFRDVARAVSEHPSARQDGYIGETSRAALPPALADAAFSATIGAYTQPIHAEAGYYILKIEARSAAKKPSFEELKPALRQRIEAARLQQVWLQWLSEARKAAAIERKWRP